MSTDDKLTRPAADRPILDAREFQEAGYLAEVNRRVLHPLGLALSVEMQPDGTIALGPIFDERDDPEGFVYGWAQMPPHVAATLAERFANVNRLWKEREPARNAALGFMVQPGTKP